MEGEICAVFAIANLNGPRLRERPQTAPEVSEQLPGTYRVAAAVPPRVPTKIIFLIKKLLKTVITYYFRDLSLYR